MKCLRNFLSVLLVLGVCVLIAPPAKAGIPITQSTCPIMITQPGEYNLATDLACNGTDGIDISASDVTLHLDGHTITGAAAGTCSNRVGIYIFPPVLGAKLSQVRVLGDGTIRNFVFGFLAENSNDSFVKFTTVTASCPSFMFSTGFAIYGPGSHWKLQGNVVREPGPTSTGIYLQSIRDSHLVANDVNNVINLFDDSSNNVIANNIADDNAGFGGIFIFRSNNNEIHANTTNHNTRAGVWIYQGSTGNSVTGNYSFANSPFDMEDDNPCGANKWRGNHFGKANKSCIRSGKDDDSGEDEDRKDDDRG